MGPRGDAIVQLDWCVGELMSAVEKMGLTEETLFVFCSDNGPVLDDGYKDDAIEKLGDHDPNGPFKGGKYNVYEGGTRTPFITRMPGTIKPGVSNAVVCTVDLANSLSSWSGGSIPDEACLDSMNVMDALLGKSDEGRAHLIQQDNGRDGNYGLRVGRWKLVQQSKGKSRNVALRLVAENVDVNSLYDLDADPGETTNVAAQYPEVLKDMMQQLEAHLDRGRTR